MRWHGARFLASAFLCLPLLVIFLFSSDASAQGRKKTFQVKTSSSLKLTPGFYFDDVGPNTTQYSGATQATTEISVRAGKSWRMKFSPYIYSDPASLSTREKFFLDVNEAKIFRRFGDLSFDLGINQVSWGVTDVYNPLDVVSPKRLFDPLNSEKRGVPSLTVGYETGDWRLEGLYVPISFESVLPGETSRWLPRDVFVPEDPEFEIQLPRDLRYSYTASESVESALTNGFGGLIEKRGSGVDLLAIFYQGASSSPSILAIISGDYIPRNPPDRPIFRADPDVQLQPIYYQRRTAGLGAVYTLETAIVKFAATYSDKVAQRNDLPGWNQSSVLGWEQNFPVYESTLTLLVQGTYGRNQDDAGNSVSSFERIFDKSLLLGLRLSTSSDWTATGAVLYDFSSLGGFAQLRLENRISDGISASLQGDLIEGERSTTLGTYRRNDRLAAGLTIFW